MVMTNLDISTLLGIPVWLLTILAIWSLAWMAFALWIAARKNHIVWYVLLLLVHTLGILDILYIYVFSKSGKNPAEQQAVKKKKI